MNAAARQEHAHRHRAAGAARACWPRSRTTSTSACASTATATARSRRKPARTRIWCSRCRRSIAPRCFKIIDAARPRGETPLVYSVLQAIADLKAAGGGSVVLITDGEESCGGDFAAAAAAIKQSGLDFRLNIVGFTLQGQTGAEGARPPGREHRRRVLRRRRTAPRCRARSRPRRSRRFPFSVKDATGKVVAEGEAGDPGHDLAPGDYTIVVQAGDQALTLPHVTVAAGPDGDRARDAQGRQLRGEPMRRHMKGQPQ